ncbi:MAG: hypothetical protein PHV47_00105 [Candidatus Pacebacteria bacterium]|nr:hypothetical protein [Candidatus Paceibacterota bacterium]MDD5621423.1 hypothetical protein [Candidatus Paceibacterota bacterium]
MKKSYDWKADLRRARWFGFIFYICASAISGYGLYRHNHIDQLVALAILVVWILPLTAWAKAKKYQYWFIAFWMDVGAIAYIASSLAFKHQSALEGWLIPLAAVIGGAFLLFWDRGMRNKRKEEIADARNTNRKRR